MEILKNKTEPYVMNVGRRVMDANGHVGFVVAHTPCGSYSTCRHKLVCPRIVHRVRWGARSWAQSVCPVTSESWSVPDGEFKRTLTPFPYKRRTLKKIKYWCSDTGETITAYSDGLTFVETGGVR